MKWGTGGQIDPSQKKLSESKALLVGLTRWLTVTVEIKFVAYFDFHFS